MNCIHTKFRKDSSNDSLDIIVKPKIDRFHAADILLFCNLQKKKKLLEKVAYISRTYYIERFRTYVSGLRVALTSVVIVSYMLVLLIMWNYYGLRFTYSQSNNIQY